MDQPYPQLLNPDYLAEQSKTDQKDIQVPDGDRQPENRSNKAAEDKPEESELADWAGAMVWYFSQNGGF